MHKIGKDLLPNGSKLQFSTRAAKNLQIRCPGEINRVGPSVFKVSEGSFYRLPRNRINDFWLQKRIFRKQGEKLQGTLLIWILNLIWISSSITQSTLTKLTFPTLVWLWICKQMNSRQWSHFSMQEQIRIFVYHCVLASTFFIG